MSDCSDSFPQLNFPAEASNEEINDEGKNARKIEITDWNNLLLTKKCSSVGVFSATQQK